MRNVFTMGVGLMILVSVGCGGGNEDMGKREPVFPVAGKVIYKGQPVVGADVTFFCKEKNLGSFGKTDEQGKFRMTSYSSFDGSPAGKQIITVSKLDAPVEVANKDIEVSDPAYDPFKVEEAAKRPPPKNVIPIKYADAKTTDLFATITADKNNPEVVLELKD